MNSSQYFARSKLVSPGGVHSPVRSFKNIGQDPIFFRSAQGAYLESVEGKKYLDFCLSFGPHILGHRDPEVEEQVIAMVKCAWSFGACEPYSLELAEWITQRVPWVEKIRFVSSGTEAVMSALRIARAATGRPKVLKFDGCYHGHLDSLLVKAGSGLAGVSASSSAGVSEQVAGETLTCGLDNDKELEEIFALHGSTISCIALEPLPANYGLLIQRKEFIQKACALAKQHGALILFDEVISGFRVALGGMAEVLAIKPDLVTYGKILGGGFPVGAYGGSKELLDLVAPLGPVYQAGTLSANPVGMRAGLATLQKLERMNAWAVLEERTQTFCLKLTQALQNADAPFHVSQFSSLFWIYAKTSQPPRSPQAISSNQGTLFAPFFRAALGKDIYLAPNAYEVGFVSLAHDPQTLSEAAHLLGEAARAP